MDVYSPEKQSPSSFLDSRVKLLFVHGGMWMFGSKDHEIPSFTEFVKGLVSLSFPSSSTDSNPNPLFQKAAISNVGATIARQGGQAYIINYRLVNSLVDHSMDAMRVTQSHSNLSIYSEQVMDVARAISFLIKQEWKERQSLRSKSRGPNIFVTGMSAGAHLTALALTDMTYLHRALTEVELDPNTLSLQDYIAGYIGFSGPYNLRRLFQSPLADLTIGPAFLGKGLPKQSAVQRKSLEDNSSNQPISDNNLDSILADSSPIHVLLLPPNHQSTTNIPLVCKVPVLLINAQDDFHLSQDSQELLIAMSHYAFEKDVERGHVIIPSTNHLTLMKEFGVPSVQDCNGVDEETRIRFHHETNETNSRGWSISDAWNYHQPRVLNSSNQQKKDGSMMTRHVLEFMSRVSPKR